MILMPRPPRPTCKDPELWTPKLNPYWTPHITVYIYMYICRYTHTYIRRYIHTSIHTHNIYIYINICIYIYTKHTETIYKASWGPGRPCQALHVAFDNLMVRIYRALLRPPKPLRNARQTFQNIFGILLYFKVYSCTLNYSRILLYF